MCTGIRLKAENKSIIYARTLEFGQETASNIIMIPREYELKSEASQGLSWRSRYAVVGANMLNITGVVDGVNEKGLAGGLFYFPGYAAYQKISADEMAQSIAPWELLTWILTTCETVDQVRTALPKIKVAEIVFKEWSIVPPIHAIVHEAQGKSLMIEYIAGELVMRDNPLGVITNSPSFDWHMINMSNYINLSATNAAALKSNGLSFAPLGQGSGMLGLPGDFTPPSRFIRAAFFSQSAQDIKTEHEACKTAFRLLDLFNISVGLVRETQEGKNYYDYTQWTSAADLSNKRYYWHTYDNRQVQMVDLMQMNITGKETTIIKMHYDEIKYDHSKE